jgi:hypothetical protein
VLYDLAYIPGTGIHFEIDYYIAGTTGSGVPLFFTPFFSTVERCRLIGDNIGK